MNQQKNENRNSHDQNRSNQRTNQEEGRNDLNQTDRDQRDSEREFDLDDDKQRNLKVTSKGEDPSKDKTLDKKNQDKSLPRHEDPNVNAENENRKEKTGTMRNEPKSNRMLAEE
jgi:hypothetical protein